MCYTSLSRYAWIASIALSSDAEGYSSEHTIAICKAIMIVDGNLSLFSAQQMVNKQMKTSRLLCKVWSATYYASIRFGKCIDDNMEI